MNKRDFITIRSFTAAEIRKLLEDAIDIKANPSKYSESLKREDAGDDL